MIQSTSIPKREPSAGVPEEKPRAGLSPRGKKPGHRSLLPLIALIVGIGLLTAAAGFFIVKSFFPGDTPVPEETAEPAVTLPEGEILFQDGVICAGAPATVKENIVQIEQAGEYHLSGTLADGRILVDVPAGTGDVILHLDGLDLTCVGDSALQVKRADTLCLSITAGTENRLASCPPENDPSLWEESMLCVLYAKANVTISGAGSLCLAGDIQDALVCKGNLRVEEGTVNLISLDTGIRARDSFTMEGGTLTIASGGDGLKTTGAQEEYKGNITLSGGTLSVSSGCDGISSSADLVCTGGTLEVETDYRSREESSKALKADGDISLEGAAVTLTTRRDSGISADGDVTITSGTVTVDAVGVGISAGHSVDLDGGEVTVAAGKTGLKAGNVNEEFPDWDARVTVSGGSVTVYSYGQPLSSPVTAVISGGVFFASGNVDKPELFDEDSPQEWIRRKMEGEAGSEVLARESGLEPRSYRPVYPYNYLIYSSPTFSRGSFSFKQPEE